MHTAPETPCYCAACHTGADKCFRKLTDDEMLDAYGFDRRGRTRTVGKGPELREQARTVDFETVKRLFP